MAKVAELRVTEAKTLAGISPILLVISFVCAITSTAAWPYFAENNIASLATVFNASSATPNDFTSANALSISIAGFNAACSAKPAPAIPAAPEIMVWVPERYSRPRSPNWR